MVDINIIDGFILWYINSICYVCSTCGFFLALFLQTLSGYMTPVGNEMTSLPEIRRVSKSLFSSPSPACHIYLHAHFSAITHRLLYTVFTWSCKYANFLKLILLLRAYCVIMNIIPPKGKTCKSFYSSVFPPILK